MLKKIRLTDFKSFVDEEVELAPLTLLVGANASGKSNFLDAIRFLQGLSFDLTLGEVLNGEESSRPDAWPGVRGRAPEAARVGTSSFSIETLWLHPNMPPEARAAWELWHRISCQTEPIPSLEEETVSRPDKGQAVTFSARPGMNNTLEVYTLLPGASSPKRFPTRLSTSKNLLSQDFERALASPGDLLPHRMAFQLNLWKSRFLEMKPDKMRDYGRRGAPLGDEGKNLSGVLADQCSVAEDKRSLIDWLTEICAPDLKDLEFVDVPQLGDVMAMFVESGGRRISARSISDGTLRFLGTLLSLRSADSELLLIEEIESGLHPTRIHLLVEFLESVARERDTQIIATTHSPVVLQWLSDEALRNVIVFGRVPDHEGTIMRRLGDLPHFGEVVQRKGIEELFTTGWLEMAL